MKRIKKNNKKKDDIHPTFTSCLTEMIPMEATESGGANVTFATPVATDTADGNVNVACVPASGTVLYAVGTHTINCTAVDDTGNAALCQLTAKVTGIRNKNTVNK